MPDVQVHDRLLHHANVPAGEQTMVVAVLEEDEEVIETLTGSQGRKSINNHRNKIRCLLVHRRYLVRLRRISLQPAGLHWLVP